MKLSEINLLIADAKTFFLRINLHCPHRAF